jgi:penicillin G amidase
MTANNRHVPDNALYDYGGTIMSTGRAQRIDEMIQEQIASGKKFTPADMARIQQDVHDIISRRMTPVILDLAKQVREDFSPEEQKDLDQMMSIMDGWDGAMDADSI